MKVLRWTAAVLVSAAGLWLALRGVDRAAVAAVFKNLAHPGVFFLLPLSAGAEFAMRAFRWRLLLGGTSNRGPLGYFALVTASFFLNNVLPFRAGELARVYWTQRTGVDVAAAVGVLAADRMMDILSVAALMAAFLIGARGQAVPRLLGPASLAGAGCLLAALLAAARFHAAITRHLPRLPGPQGLKDKAAAFCRSLAPLADPRTFFSCLFLSLAFWAMNAGLFAAVGRALGLSLAWRDGAWLLAVLALGVALPSTPGYVGTYEASGVAALTFLGIEKSAAFSCVLLIHAGQLLGVFLWGIPSFIMMQRTARGAA